LNKRSLFAGLLLGLVSLASAAFPAQDSESGLLPAAKTVKGETAKKLDAYLTRIVPFGFSGALLVADHGEVILNKGYGLAVRSLHLPNTEETVFSTGSVTKQFTAAGIMKLEMEGKLKTEDPITVFFDDVPQDKRSITLHHLLTHTSGVVEYTGPDFVVAERQETVRKILEAPLRHPPGERFAYSNAGYSLLAAVIEKVSGMTYEAFLRENLFLPAGMKSTGYRLPEWKNKVVAHWYVGDKDNGTPLEKPYPYWNLLGNGGILSTTGDMLRWHRALLGEKILSAAVKKKMFTPYLNDYGYGWDVLETERGLLIQHDGGSTLGSSSEFRRYIDAGVVTILFCNQSYGRGTLMEAVRDKIEILVFGGEVPLPPEIRPSPPADLSRYAGTYVLESGDRFEVRPQGSSLVIRAEGQDAVTRLFDPENPDPGRFADLNRIAQSAFNAVLRGNYEPLGEVLRDRERRMPRVRELIEARCRMAEQRTGRLKRARARGTLPATLDGEKTALTYVELEGEKGSLFFALYWKGKENVGIGPAMAPDTMAIPFSPISASEFAGYRIDTGVVSRVKFILDEKGAVTGLSFSGREEAPVLKKSSEG